MPTVGVTTEAAAKWSSGSWSGDIVPLMRLLHVFALSVLFALASCVHTPTNASDCPKSYKPMCVVGSPTCTTDKAGCTVCSCDLHPQPQPR
jgi:hypothetical protein